MFASHPSAIWLPNATAETTISIECSECEQVLDAETYEETSKLLPLCVRHYQIALASLEKRRNRDEINAGDIARIKTRLHVNSEDIRDILAYRPSTESLLMNLKPWVGPRTRYHKIVQKTNFWLSNEHAPFLNMGRWGKPHYNSCQDYTDLSWSASHLKMQHHTEDPSVFIAWIGDKFTSMKARALVRIIQPLASFEEKGEDRYLGIDAFYGDSSLAPILRNSILQYAKDKGYKGLGIITSPNSTPEMLWVTHHSLPAVFTSDMTSYADIGRWVKVNDLHSFHVSGLRDLVRF